MFPLVIANDKFPRTSVQIPWSNTDIGAYSKKQHLPEALSGKTHDIIANTDDYKIILPYTMSAIDRNVVGLPAILDTGTDDLYALFSKGYFPYIVEYSNTMGKGLINYTKTLVLVGNDNVRFFTGTSTSRDKEQFLNDLPYDVSENQIKINHLVLTAILNDVSKRKIHPFHEIQDLEDSKEIRELSKNPDYVENLLHNPNLRSRDLVEIFDNFCDLSNFGYLLKIMMRHPSSEQQFFQSHALQKIMDDDSLLIIVAESPNATAATLDLIFSYSGGFDSNIEEKMLVAIVKNKHTSEYTLNSIAQRDISFDTAKGLLTNFKLYNLPNNDDIVKKIVKKWPQLKGLATKTKILRALSFKK
jgi:hypothetical protein